MSWFSELFSSGVSKVIESVGSVIDNLDTSEHEKITSNMKK